MQKSKHKRIIPFAIAFGFVLFYMLFDGISLFTLLWKEEKAIVLTSIIKEYPIQTSKQGTLIGYTSECLIELNNSKYTIFSNTKIQAGTSISVRINPETNVPVAVRPNYTFFYIICTISLVLIIGGLIQIFATRS